MPSITKIFLDLDDTLNAFTMSALAEVGCEVGPFDFDKFNPKWGMDIVRAANELHPKRAFSKMDFWNSLDYDFWRSIPRSTELERILEICAELVGEDNVCILTAFFPDFEQSYVASAKSQWIRDFLPEWLRGHFLIGPRKDICASPEALLIDDSSKNVKAFRKAGGHAILVPRPWNLLHYIPTLEHLERTVGQRRW